MLLFVKILCMSRLYISQTRFHSFTPKADREGGTPLDINLQSIDIDGFLTKNQYGSSRFIPPCVYYSSPMILRDQSNVSVPKSGAEKVYTSDLNICFICFLFFSFLNCYFISFLVLYFPWLRSHHLEECFWFLYVFQLVLAKAD